MQAQQDVTETARCTSGSWLVEAGKEERFIALWTRFTSWSLENAPGARSFTLIKDESDERHFLSFGVWDDHESVIAWRQRPEFAERFGECRAQCEDFKAGDYLVAAQVGS